MITITSDTNLLYTDRPARVMAGPGAGKTHWLAAHTKNVFRRSKKLHPCARIAVISYTNIAADEIKQKLGSDATRVDVGTIHSFLYLNVIKPYLHLVKSGNGQQLVNTALIDGHDEHHVNHKKVEDWLTLVKSRQVLRDQVQTTRLKEALAFVRWNQHIDPAQWTLGVNPPAWLAQQLWRPLKAKFTPELLHAYKEFYWADGHLDHDDILYFATQLLNKYPIITSFLSARYPFLFIDEFQDTAPAQTNIVHLLGSNGTTVVIIGDAEQSIYMFAGAHPEHFRTFALRDLDEYTIDDNRRSTDRIIELLNHVRRDGISQRGVRAKQGEPVKLIVGVTSRAAQYARTVIDQNEDLLIVARTGNLVQAAQLLGGAATANPWESVSEADGDRKILFHNLFAGVILARQHRYDLAVRTVLRGVRHRKGKLKAPISSAAPRCPQQRRAIAITLLEVLIKLGKALDAMTLQVAYDHCLRALTHNFEGIKLTQSTRGAFFEISQQVTCGDLLRSAKLTQSEEVRDARTIHQSKGMERQNVLVCLNGRDNLDTNARLNHILNPTTPSDEEQRITYVAISRARERLFLATPALTHEQEQRAIELGISVIRLEAQ